MCYHISIPERTELDDLFDHAVRTDEWDTYYHHLSGFSFAKIPVLASGQPDKLKAFNWGLIPSWVKNKEQAKELSSMCLNAKSETIFEKPSFRSSINNKRCLVFVNGFYEWQDFNKKKYPYFIHLKDQSCFALGGVYEEWIDKETGEIINTVSIVTTEANQLMAKIHNLKLRMPLIFDKQTMFDWINPDLKREDISEMMKPFDEKLMDAYTISKLITSRKESPNRIEVKEKFNYPELLE